VEEICQLLSGEVSKRVLLCHGAVHYRALESKVAHNLVECSVAKTEEGKDAHLAPVDLLFDGATRDETIDNHISFLAQAECSTHGL